MTSLIADDPTPSTRAIFQMAWPMTLKMIMLHSIVVIDAFLVAPLGEQTLAAMGLAASIGGLLMGVLMAFSNATQIRVAQAFGSGQNVALKTGLYCGLIINLAAACLGFVIVVLVGDDIIRSFAHTPEIATQALAYLHVFMLAVFAEAAGQALSGHFNGCGKPRMSLTSYLIAVPANVVISIVLIHGHFGFPELGLVGAAVGSVAASVMRLIYLGVRLFQTDRAIIHCEGWLRGTLRESLIRHFKFSLPIAATFISAFTSTSVCTLLYASLSVNQFAAMTLIMPWVQVAGTLGMAWAQATGIFVAQLLGRGLSGDHLDRFLSRAWRGAFVGAALASATYTTVCLSSGWLYGDLQAETRAALLSFLPILMLLPFPKGSNAICGNTLRAGGDTVYVLNIFAVGQWLFKVPMTALFVLYLDLSVTWVFALFLFEELVKFPLFHMRLFKRDWQRGVLD